MGFNVARDVLATPGNFNWFRKKHCPFQLAASNIAYVVLDAKVLKPWVRGKKGPGCSSRNELSHATRALESRSTTCFLEMLDS